MPTAREEAYDKASYAIMEPLSDTSIACVEAASGVWEYKYRELLRAARKEPYVVLEKMAMEVLGAES